MCMNLIFYQLTACGSHHPMVKVETRRASPVLPKITEAVADTFFSHHQAVYWPIVDEWPLTLPCV